MPDTPDRAFEYLAVDPAEALGFVVETAQAAGEVHRKYWRELDPADVHRKSTPRDLQTRADTESEQLIVGRLATRFPGHSVFAEEGNHRRGDPRVWWFVDPLDGTVNFAHGLPVFAVSIACYVDGRPVLACVHAPVLGETATAAAGRGTHLNGRPVRVSGTPTLGEALVATGFAYQRNLVRNNNLAAFNTVVLRVRGIRRMGACAIDLLNVACGRIDGFWEPYLGPYDVAAGALLIREAGGRVTDYQDGEDWLFGETMVASNGQSAIHEALRDAAGALDDDYQHRYAAPEGFLLAGND